MLQENDRLSCFISPALIEKETQERLQLVLKPPIVLSTPEGQPAQKKGKYL
jgi:hypothetical protein